MIARLVGRQKFEKKGANPGGGGGAPDVDLRDRFKFVSYWNPALALDPNGSARFSFALPDNLTGWRILAIAVTPEDRMGLGDTRIAVNQATELRPALPNQVRVGDTFEARFTVMNRSAAPRRIDMRVTVEGPLAAEVNPTYQTTAMVAPYERVPFGFPLTGSRAGTLRFTVRAGDASDTDALVQELVVVDQRTLETAALYGSTDEAEVVTPIDVPAEIHAETGVIETLLSPTVIGNLDGAFAYLKDYPHQCWEQRLTKAVAAATYLRLRANLDPDTRWDHAGSDVTRALHSAVNFQAPNGGMSFWRADNTTVNPYLSAYTALAFNWLRAGGHDIPSPVEKRLHDYLLALLRTDEFPTFYTSGMASSVRAVALAALAQHRKVDGGDVRRHARHMMEMDLFGKAHLLAASTTIGDDAETIRARTLRAILAHGEQSAGKLQFNETWDDSYRHVLATPLRANCAVLSSLVDLAKHERHAASLTGMPMKIVRAITQSRGRRDYFENTQENVFCLNAIVDYANAFEQHEPRMQVRVALDAKPLGATQFRAQRDPMVMMRHALSEAERGQRHMLSIEKQGAGRLYYSTRLRYSPLAPAASRVNAGIEVRREYAVERNGIFTLLDSPAEIRRGELVRVDLFVSVPTARHFVVVNDPIPGGLEAVNTDLATSSAHDARKAAFQTSATSWFHQRNDWTAFGRYHYSFYHQELRFDAARFYADYLPAGHYHLSYSAQAIATGSFDAPPTHVEEMYDPDVYGRGLPSRVEIRE